MIFDKIHQFNFPTTIRFGAGAVKELPAYLAKNNLKAPLIVTDPTIAQLPFFKNIVADLKAKNISVEVFSDIHKNPVKSDVYKGTDAWGSTQRDSIVGIGGGAALDVARAIVLRVNHREDLFKYDDLIGGDVYVTNEVPHFITIPTTSGTGSEVGRSAIIADDETHQKKNPVFTQINGADCFCRSGVNYGFTSFHYCCYRDGCFNTQYGSLPGQKFSSHV